VASKEKQEKRTKYQQNLIDGVRLEDMIGWVDIKVEPGRFSI
jgi:hypothetical protein